MNAVSIIDAIKHLPPGEQAEVVRLVRKLDASRPWTAQQVSSQADKLPGTRDPAASRGLKEQIAGGFYGGGSHA